MHRKDHLRELIKTGKSQQEQNEAHIKRYEEELKEIKQKETRLPSPKLTELRQTLQRNPGSFKIRQELTIQALEEENGTFVAWRGGEGTPPEAQFVEIEQPLFNSENVLDNPPIVKQHFHVLSVLDNINDLKGLLDVVQPDCMITLPQHDLHYFSEFQTEPTTYVVEGSDVPVENLVPFNHKSDNISDKINLAGETAGETTIGGRTKGLLQRIYQPLYDTNTVATSGSGQLNFFQVPLGGRIAGSTTPKTQVDTNMDQGGSLPYPKNFKVTGISVIPDASASYEDAAKVLDGSWFRLFIGTQDYYVSPTLPLAFAPGKRSPGMSFRVNNPLRPVYCFPEPISLIPQQNFRVELNFPKPFTKDNALSEPLRIRVVLHGYFYREVMEMFKSLKAFDYSSQRLGSYEAESKL